MEIGLPDEKGRLQILKIHTKKMKDSNFMGRDVSLEELSTHTKNFSGAEIEGLVKSATSFAFNRQIEVTNGIKLKEGEMTVNRQDFMLALQEVRDLANLMINVCRLNLLSVWMLMISKTA